MVALMLAVALLVPALASAQVAGRRPLALSEIDDSARYLFASARDGKWPQAEAQLPTLQHGFDNLPSDLGPADVLASLHTRVHELADTVPHREQVKTMDAANAITQLLTGLNSSFDRVPAEIPRLGYLGRQIELGVVAHKRQVIARAITDMRQAWEEVRPQVEQRGHMADVRRMTDIVVSLEGMHDMRQVERLAGDELEMVAHLEAEMQ